SATVSVVVPALRSSATVSVVAQPFRAASHHAINIATATVVVASSSGSVIGVDCRYSTFGFSANTAAPAAAAAADPVSDSTIAPPSAATSAVVTGSVRGANGIITRSFYGENRQPDPRARADARCPRSCPRRLPRFVVPPATGHHRRPARRDGHAPPGRHAPTG